MLKDIENILQIAGSEKKEKTEIPFSIERKIQHTFININNDKIGIKKIIQSIIWIIITIVSSTGVCWATIHVYNEYIKKQGTTRINVEIADLMIWDEKNGIYYKIINNYDEYKKFKERIDTLPEMSPNDLESESLLIITWSSGRELHETDLEVVDVTSNNTTTNIILNQKTNPNYYSNNNLIFSVISNEQLKDNIKIQIEHYQIVPKGYTSIDELTENYTVEQAIQDGCVVIESTILKSEDPYAIDKFIEKTENGENSFIRIYDKQSKSTYIHDIEYKDGVYYERTKDIMNIDKINYFNSYEKLLKINNSFGEECFIYVEIIRKQDVEYLAYPRNNFYIEVKKFYKYQKYYIFFIFFYLF